MNTNIRADFPLLRERSGIAYLDSAATAQKPECVIRAEADFYREHNANPLRGLYEISQEATDAYESARAKTAAFLNAESAEEIIFTRNATESMNLLAYSQGSLLRPGDEIVISIAEHHSNFLPWQIAYSEFYFTDTLWPDFDRAEFVKAIRYYSGRDRRYGGVSNK